MLYRASYSRIKGISLLFHSDFVDSKYDSMNACFLHLKEKRGKKSMIWACWKHEKSSFTTAITQLFHSLMLDSWSIILIILIRFHRWATWVIKGRREEKLTWEWEEKLVLFRNLKSTFENLMIEFENLFPHAKAKFYVEESFMSVANMSIVCFSLQKCLKCQNFFFTSLIPLSNMMIVFQNHNRHLGRASKQQITNLISCRTLNSPHLASNQINMSFSDLDYSRLLRPLHSTILSSSSVSKKTYSKTTTTTIFAIVCIAKIKYKS